MDGQPRSAPDWCEADAHETRPNTEFFLHDALFTTKVHAVVGKTRGSSNLRLSAGTTSPAKPA